MGGPTRQRKLAFLKISNVLLVFATTGEKKVVGTTSFGYISIFKRRIVGENSNIPMRGVQAISWL
jgi:hypothetical protein